MQTGPGPPFIFIVVDRLSMGFMSIVLGLVPPFLVFVWVEVVLENQNPILLDLTLSYKTRPNLPQPSPDLEALLVDA